MKLIKEQAFYVVLDDGKSDLARVYYYRRGKLSRKEFPVIVSNGIPGTSKTYGWIEHKKHRGVRRVVKNTPPPRAELSREADCIEAIVFAWRWLMVGGVA